jgi:hypothetical protein
VPATAPIATITEFAIRILKRSGKRRSASA